MCARSEGEQPVRKKALATRPGALVSRAVKSREEPCLNEATRARKLPRQRLRTPGPVTTRRCVWGESTMVGIGIAMTKDGKTVVVANYNPRGNVEGEKPYGQ